MISRDLRQDVLSLYSLSSALIEAFAAELVKRELVVEEHRELDRVDKVFQRATGVKENLRLLYDMDVIAIQSVRGRTPSLLLPECFVNE
jgi:hypothetical protein